MIGFFQSNVDSVASWRQVQACFAKELVGLVPPTLLPFSQIAALS